MSLLEISALGARYGRVQVLHDLELSVDEGEAVTLLGANGAGKTSTLRAATGLIPASGAVRFAGRDVAGRPAEAIARLGMAHVPEGRGTLVALTVDENLRIAGYARCSGAARRAEAERCYALFPRLRERARQRAGTLSGGEQQMLAIARALMLRPRLILLDEPSMGLSPRITREIFAALGALRRSDGVALLIVEQNAELALGLADRAYLLERGRLVREGTAHELRGDEATRRAYLGY